MQCLDCIHNRRWYVDGFHSALHLPTEIAIVVCRNATSGLGIFRRVLLSAANVHSSNIECLHWIVMRLVIFSDFPYSVSRSRRILYCSSQCYLFFSSRPRHLKKWRTTIPLQTSIAYFASLSTPIKPKMSVDDDVPRVAHSPYSERKLIAFYRYGIKPHVYSTGSIFHCFVYGAFCVFRLWC